MINGLDHVNIRVADLRATLTFYTDVLGMRCAPVPGDEDMSARAWIFSGDGRPAVHVGSGALGLGFDRSFDAKSGSGVIDHVAFDCSDYEGVRARLASQGVTARFNDVPMAGLRQIFITDPNGILIELNFRTAPSPPKS